MLQGYKTIYTITSNNDPSQPLTTQSHDKLINILHIAVLQNQWGKIKISEFTVYNKDTYTWSKKILNLDEIIAAMQQVISPIKHATTTILQSAALATIMLAAGGIYYLHHTNPTFMHYAIEDAQDTLKSTLKYFTDPWTYTQFEKKHELLSEAMTQKERQERFEEWQTGQMIQDNIDANIKNVARFEKKLDLPSRNMIDEDRIAIYKEWQAEQRILQRMQEKMKPIIAFEKQHQLLSDNMTEKERCKRYQKWQHENRKQKSMQEKLKDVSNFENKHELEFNHMTQNERLIRYKEWVFGNEQQQELQKTMRSVAALEQREKLPIKHLHDYERIERFEKITAEKQRERTFKAIELAEKDNWWLKLLNENKGDEERIKNYLQHTDPIERYWLENETFQNIKKNLQNN
jgi:hypothetical protein